MWSASISCDGRRSWLLSAVVVLACSMAGAAQNATDEQVKAAYLYNFAKFVEWPAHAFAGSNAPIRLCVFNQDPIEADLRKIVEGKSIANHSVAVVAVRTEAEYRACHVLFIRTAQGGQAKQILEGLRGASVLTVSDAEEFVREGGIIQFVLNNDRIQFEVNHKAAGDAQLEVSSRLLRVAKAVIE